ncbi:hypothetical protein EV130_105341 [Rhizobium azibense]|uniref:Uncharacterized protein n=1 Tax=Rhizobium azibense TaxID=1136135 RepID=A0A4R3QTL0_9HYPH|nr:hypothetical protein EV130_105341 [Rhizobium azibense]TCU40033.1 hypothetical protein EV129_102170 [Rhizobium azibense]
MRAGRRAHSGALFPAASTEVVMAQRWNSMPYFAASLRDAALSTFRTPVVTGTQTVLLKGSSEPKDLEALSSCDRRRNEGWLRYASAVPSLTPQVSR